MILYAVSDLFEDKRKLEIRRKWDVVRPHYEKIYKVKLRSNLPETEPQEVEKLYKSMQKLNDTVWSISKKDHL